MATASHFSIEGCEFAFRCPRRWEQLAETAEDDQRYCVSCKRIVYRCDNPSLLEVHAKAGHCVAVPDRTGDGLSVGNLSMEYGASKLKRDR